jgi:hypothetical protein
MGIIERVVSAIRWGSEQSHVINTLFGTPL